MKKKTTKLAKTRRFWEWFRDYIDRTHPGLWFCRPEFYFGRSASEKSKINRIARKALREPFKKDQEKQACELRNYLDELVIKDLHPVDIWKGHVACGQFTTGAGFERFEQIFPDLRGTWDDVVSADCIGKPCDPSRKR